MVSADEFRFLNQQERVAQASAWDDPGRPALWNYNLHYFDDLNAEGAEERTDWHRALIDRWVRENPPFEGIGWDPYPTSLRIVNWIKWAARGNSMESAWLESLALQARWLRRRLEYHLLANHLLANAKALVFAGALFEGEEAEGWLRKGLAILEREMPEQILSDGGHFERSPMYHSIVLEDVLDLVNLLEGLGARGSSSAAAVAAEGRSYGASMMGFLGGMCHPDGEIAFFNDAAFGIAPRPAQLFEYAEQLGMEPPPAPGDGLTHFADSGYIRCQAGPLVALLDVAPVGPDYQPGHAHADTLSFELSLFGHRVFVNSGTSTYEEGAERLRQRGTLAHNTVAIDGENSSEVWKSFRVARKANPENLRMRVEKKEICVSCQHDGFKRLHESLIHHRTWRFRAGELNVVDNIFGGRQPDGLRAPRSLELAAVASFHLHPDVKVKSSGRPNELSLLLSNERSVSFSCNGGSVQIDDSFWHREFGMSIASKVIHCQLNSGPMSCHIK